MLKICIFFIGCLLHLASCPTLFSQAFISGVFEETVIVGPKNVQYLDSLLCTAYIYEIEIFQDELMAYQMDNLQEIDRMTSKKFIWKGNKLEALQNLDLQIDHELSLTLRIKQAWERSILHLEAVKVIKQDRAQDSCLVVQTKMGEYALTELSLDSVLIPITERYNNQEIIKSVITSSDEKVWVKKKTDPSCISINPEDCLVWCLVNRPGMYKLEMIDGGLFQSSDIPEDFEFGQGIISRPALYEETSSSHVYRIIEKRHNTEIEVLGLRSDCN